MVDPPPVVIITGMNDDAAIDEAMALGAKQCIRKPFRMDEILEAVNEACPQPNP
jgi:FixJ family two-component response regulator